MSALRDSLIVSKNLGRIERRTFNNIKEAVQVTQAAVMNEAKSNHPYTDRTQNLTNSIQAGKIVIGLNFIVGGVVANAEYAEFVEFGTSNSRPFPFMGPAVLNEIQRYRQRVANAIKL